jgi:anti-sigma-K factor RskA
MNADVHALTGAYVLDAVSDMERAEFERHLTVCDACRQEVAELRETASRLGAAATAEPPPRMRTAVLSRISEVRQLPPDAPVIPLRRPSWALRMTSVAAAVLLVATVVLGTLLVRAQDSLQDTEAQAAQVSSILGSGDAQIATQGDESSGRMVALMSRSENRMLLLTDELPAAPSGKDYQAWTIGDQVTSAGLITPRDGRASLEVSGIDDAELVGITLEPTGGSDQPTADPIMKFAVA